MDENTSIHAFQLLLAADLTNINFPLKPHVSDVLTFEEAGAEGNGIIVKLVNGSTFKLSIIKTK